MCAAHSRWPPAWPEITDPLVLDALASVPRREFVPPEYQDQAYEDAPLPIGFNQTISQPFIVALMTQALRLTPESRVLEVGTGSGYQAAILAHISRHVWSVEALPVLAEAARARLARLGYGVIVKTGDGRLGWPEHAPYDAIVVTAAPVEVPPPLVQQLAPGGRLVIPFGESQWAQNLWRIEKDDDGRLRAEKLGEVRFVPLIHSAPPIPEDAGQVGHSRAIREVGFGTRGAETVPRAKACRWELDCMRVVITGHNGRLGRQLMAAFSGHELLTLDLPADDIADPRIVGRIAAFRPDLVVHAAAYTDVDGAEKDPELAFRANAFGTQNMALASQASGAALLLISTNEVFDGSQREPYREWDAINPISTYARSKAAAERIALTLTPRVYIARVAWLFGPGGNNFITKILAGAEKYGELRVAADEFGNPTYAPDAARAMARLAETGHYGIYHLTNSGFCSRYEFAAEIMRLAGKPALPITPIMSADWPRPSKPPLHAVLLNSAAACLGITLRPWQEALAEYVTALRSNA